MKLVEILSPSEALFGMMGWLTTRDKQTKLSSKDDCSEPAQLIGKFIKANKLKHPRRNWEKKLKHPKE